MERDDFDNLDFSDIDKPTSGAPPPDDSQRML